MHSLEFLEINKRVWLPENLGECNERQYLDMAKLILMYQLDDISYEEFRVQGLYALLNLKAKKKENQSVQEDKWNNIYQCSELLDTFFTIDDDGKKHLVQDFIHNPMPKVNYKLRTYTGPNEAFQNICYGQLEDGIGELQNFIRYGELQALVKLFAIFYLKRKEKYSKVDLEKRVRHFKHLDIRFIYGFYLLFLSYFNFLTSQCVISVDGRELDLSILFHREENEEETTPDDEMLGIRSTSFQLAESGIFGTLPELRESDVTIVLVKMHDMLARKKLEDKARQEAEEKAKQQ